MTRHTVKKHTDIGSSVETASLKCHSGAACFWSTGGPELQDFRILNTSVKFERFETTINSKFYQIWSTVVQQCIYDNKFQTLTMTVRDSGDLMVVAEMW